MPAQVQALGWVVCMDGGVVSRTCFRHAPFRDHACCLYFWLAQPSIASASEGTVTASAFLAPLVDAHLRCVPTQHTTAGPLSTCRVGRRIALVSVVLCV